MAPTVRLHRTIPAHATLNSADVDGCQCMCELAMTANITYYEKPATNANNFVLEHNAAERTELANLLMALLPKLRDSTLLDLGRRTSGIWNCAEWITQALSSRDSAVAAHVSDNKRDGRITIEFAGAQLQIAQSSTFGDLTNRPCFANAPRRKPQHVGNLVQLTFVKAENNDVVCCFEARWFTPSADDVVGAISAEEFLAGSWCFPQPMYCQLIGQAQHMRDWITMLKLSV